MFSSYCRRCAVQWPFLLWQYSHAMGYHGDSSRDTFSHSLNSFHNNTVVLQNVNNSVSLKYVEEFRYTDNHRQYEVSSETTPFLYMKTTPM